MIRAERSRDQLKDMAPLPKRNGKIKFSKKELDCPTLQFGTFCAAAGN